jgi:hypothetical protein
VRLPRFRVRTLLIAVGVVALLFWGAMMGTRSYVHYRLASLYGAQGRRWREIAVRDLRNPASARSVAAVWGLQIADDQAQLARKHRKAMWRPWTPVAPDPPIKYYPRK